MEGLRPTLLRLLEGLPGPLASIAGALHPQPSAHPAQEAEHGPKQGRRGGFASWARRPFRPKADLFGCQLCPDTDLLRGQRCQELVTTGSKVWGVGPALPIATLYHFAVYVDRRKAQGSRLASEFAGPRLAAAPRSEAFYHSLRDTGGDLDFSLVVRAARNLPIRLVAAEYRRILRARLAALGHDAGDPGLARMLEAFSEERLPARIKRGSSVLKGTVLTFSKRGDGELMAHADGMPIASVRSPPLCAAIMDLYLGPKNPVSRKARRVAGESLARMLGGEPSTPSAVGLACSLESHACKLRKA